MKFLISILRTKTPENARPIHGSGGFGFCAPALWVVVLLVGVLFSGCIVSEEDYNKVTVERDRLEEEIIRARDENRILNQAILEVYTEREVLVKRISALEKNLAEFTESEAGLPEEQADAEDSAGAPTAVADSSQPIPSRDPPPLPTEPFQIEKAPKVKRLFYTTSRGDRLSDVARRHAIPLEKLKILNRIQGDPLLPAGKKLRIQ